jgi:hypothetical protein
MTDPTNDIITRFAQDLATRVTSAIGEERVRSIFVGGSVAGDEASYCRAGDMVEIYSDVDLYAVVTDAVDLEEAKDRGRQIAAETPLEGDGYRFRRAPDIGVYSFEELASQPARPGTVGLDRRHRVLHGDPDVPVQAAERIGRQMAPEEALYLLENRLTELAALQTGRHGDGVLPARGGLDPTDPFFAFLVCKTGLDAATASYIVRDQYDPRRSERLRMLPTLAEGAGGDQAWPDDQLDVVRRCGDAMARMPSPEWADGFDPVVGADEVVSVMLELWKRIAAQHIGGETDDWSDLVLRRCRAGDYVGNFRQFRAMNARCGFKRRGVVAVGVHLSRYSSINALRLSSLTEYLSRRASAQLDVARLVDTLGSYLDRLTRECGFTEGSLSDRAYQMYRTVQ